MRSSAIAIAALALGVGLAPRLSASSETWDDFAYITFTAPVQVPGVALPAGTYLFQVADIWSNLDLIQIYSPDKRVLYATVQAMETYRYIPPDHTMITFDERPGNTPQALRVWFPRGLRYGHRFIYPGEKPGRTPKLIVLP